MGHAEGLLTISQLAATTGVSVHAIRNHVVARLYARSLTLSQLFKFARLTSEQMAR